MTFLVLLLVSIAAAFDLWRREIPDTISIVLLAMTLSAGAAGSLPRPLWVHLSGGVMALSMAMIVGRNDRFGGGDVKLFAALGCWFGPGAIVPLAMWIALGGLPLAVIAAVRGRGDMAYAPAILIGVCVHVANPNLLWQIAGGEP